MNARKIVALPTLLLMSLFVCGVSTFPQEKPSQDSVKLRAELVQIDVLVTDQNKKPVSGLAKADFELYDNNKPQNISHFSFEESKPNSVATKIPEENPVPRTLTAGDLKRVLAFIVDTLHMKQENIYSTRRLLEDFVDQQMQPGDLVLILPTAGGSGLVQQFTSDRRLLKQAISRLHPVYFSRQITPYRLLGMRNPSLRLDKPNPFDAPKGALSMPSGGIAGAPTDVDPLEQADVISTLNTLNEIVKALGKVPGRKLGVFVSEGLRLFQTDTDVNIRQTTALAARSNVVFYSIDPRGLLPLYAGADEVIASDANTTLTEAFTKDIEAKRNDLYESQTSLKTLALETGGAFFGNNNDIKRGLDDILNANAAYYMLGFQPESGAWDGKFHKIKVAVRGRPDLTVAYRKGYLAKNDSTAGPAFSDPNAAEAVEAISSPFVRRDIDLRLTPLFVYNPQREPVVTALLHIDASALHFKQANGNYQTLLDQVGYIFDAAGKAVDQFKNQIVLDLKPQTYESVLKRGIVASRVLGLKPGLYQMRLFVREVDSRLIGTANDILIIPDLKSGDLTLSSIFLHGGAIKDGKVVPMAGEGDTLSQRHFQKGGVFTFEVAAYNGKVDEKTGQAQLEMRARIRKGSQVVFTSETKPVTVGPGSDSPRSILTSRTFKLGSYPSGDYTLEVVIIDRLRRKDNVARQEIDFEID